MSSAPKTKRTCPQGHEYYKSSSCPTCPECEKSRVPDTEFLKLISAPARRALEKEGFVSEEILSLQTERKILALHGIGKTTIPILKQALEQKGLRFTNETSTPSI